MLVIEKCYVVFNFSHFANLHQLLVLHVEQHTQGQKNLKYKN